MRKEKNSDGVNIVTLGVNDEVDDIDLEIPTFLRRQAD